MTDLRTFTIQLYPGGLPHKHTCEICSDQLSCGHTDCIGPDTTDICLRCCGRFDCSQCGMDVRDIVQWEGDDGYGTDEVITRFSVKCTCGATTYYRDDDDGRGAMRVEYGPAAGRAGMRAAMIATDLAMTAAQQTSRCATLQIGNGPPVPVDLTATIQIGSASFKGVQFPVQTKAQSKHLGTVKGTYETTVTMELAPGSPTFEEFVDAALGKPDDDT